MVMQVLEAAGVPLLCDGVRQADEDNPKGYYEYEPVKRTASDASWVPNARGKAVKVVSPLLQHLPHNEAYRVIFMKRDLDEILASQRAMIERQGEERTVSDHVLRDAYQAHLGDVRRYLRRVPAFEVRTVHHRLLLDGGGGLETLLDWMPARTTLSVLLQAVDSDLYRQRAEPC